MVVFQGSCVCQVKVMPVLHKEELYEIVPGSTVHADLSTALPALVPESSVPNISIHFHTVL